MREKLPKTFQGAAVVRGLGMNHKKLDTLKERHSLDQFDATKDTWLVLSNSALANGFEEPVCFASRGKAIRYAQALGNGNANHRVVKLSDHVLVVATDNEL